MIEQLSDKPWLPVLRRAHNGDRQAFAALVRDFTGFVYQVAYSVLWHPQDAEDVVQETFLKAYLNLSTLREPLAFPTWLGRIARRLAQNRQRQLRSRPEVPPLLEESAEVLAIPDAAVEALLAREAEVAIATAIAALPEHYRSALVLRLKTGLSYEEIADILEIPVGTVRSRMHAARARLAALLVAADQPHHAG